MALALGAAYVAGGIVLVDRALRAAREKATLALS
jgi:hypothetical protein